MAEYLIFFNDEWVTDATDEEWRKRSRDVRSLVEEMKAAGVFIFTGGLDNDAPVFHVAPNGGAPVFTDGPYAETKETFRRLRCRRCARRGRSPVLGGPGRSGMRLAAGGSDLPEPRRRSRRPSSTLLRLRSRRPEMPQYLLSVHGVDSDYDPPAGKFGAYASAEEADAAMAETGRFNERLVAEGHFVFAGGLRSASTATVVDGTGDKPVYTDGPYLETKERIGGFWVIEAPDLDVALELAAEGSRACRGKVEVRPFASLR